MHQVFTWYLAHHDPRKLILRGRDAPSTKGPDQIYDQFAQVTHQVASEPRCESTRTVVGTNFLIAAPFCCCLCFEGRRFLTNNDCVAVGPSLFFGVPSRFRGAYAERILSNVFKEPERPFL